MLTTTDLTTNQTLSIRFISLIRLGTQKQEVSTKIDRDSYEIPSYSVPEHPPLCNSQTTAEGRLRAVVRNRQKGIQHRHGCKQRLHHPIGDTFRVALPRYDADDPASLDRFGKDEESDGFGRKKRRILPGREKGQSFLIEHSDEGFPRDLFLFLVKGEEGSRNGFVAGSNKPCTVANVATIHNRHDIYRR
ncbi:hypothetical protein LXL04_019467 [Taraxacum kok-saghyz]